MTQVADNSLSLFLKRIHAISTPKGCGEIYNEWAKTYDTDVRHDGVVYVGPKLTAQATVAANGNINGAVLDAGCGTGLVGVALAEAGAKNIDGIDISSGMLDIARKTGAYNDLSVVDMTKPIEKKDQSYDVITCAGTFTQGHVGPVPAFQELIRILKPDGLLVATVVDEVWIPDGYKAEAERLAASGAVEILSTEEVDYRRGTDMKARMVILKRK